MKAGQRRESISVEEMAQRMSDPARIKEIRREWEDYEGEEPPGFRRRVTFLMGIEDHNKLTELAIRRRCSISSVIRLLIQREIGEI